MSLHREHTILLSRERVNQGTKRMNSLPLSPLFQLTRFYWENRYLQILRKHYSTKLVPRPFCAQQCFWFVYKFGKGSNSLPKHFERTPKYSLESPNFGSFTRQNKHNM